MIRIGMVIAVLALVMAAASSAATLSGRGDAVAVWVAGAAAPSAVTVEVRNTNKSFMPDVIVIGAGSSVRFPNDDPFYHSIYASDGPDPFDIGYYGNGPGKVVPFPNAGVVHVRCHIHAQMHGMIVVAGGPFAQLSNGSFRLDLPPGRYVLHAVYADGSDRTSDVVLGSHDRSVNVR